MIKVDLFQHAGGKSAAMNQLIITAQHIAANRRRNATPLDINSNTSIYIPSIFLKIYNFAGSTVTLAAITKARLALGKPVCIGQLFN